MAPMLNDPEQLAKLRSLGYVGGGTPAAANSPQAAPPDAHPEAPPESAGDQPDANDGPEPDRGPSLAVAEDAGAARVWSPTGCTPTRSPTTPSSTRSC